MGASAAVILAQVTAAAGGREKHSHKSQPIRTRKARGKNPACVSRDKAVAQLKRAKVSHESTTARLEELLTFCVSKVTTVTNMRELLIRIDEDTDLAALTLAACKDAVAHDLHELFASLRDQEKAAEESDDEDEEEAQQGGGAE
eukprot:CAMPEP_0206266746 /NCGR_PEP_ID=MMETSP0047_2-20121206/30762_1 /ASSEMBLY_ACC=CAM_ASM_000192 /TAXON_ID=195065 /ORGANISM="Chroomonas mesostigmatica_cf, Strain CCMP1168" /LENGTH=143 /DNA_ID=CAMNT_0053694867 /DNA_START=146 /DNA_END=578 /DNA_ORIENTATION=+